MVRAAFIDGTGRRYVGYFTPYAGGGDGYTQPAIVVGSRQVPFWFGEYGLTRKRVHQLYGVLGVADAAALFPIHYRSSLRVLNAARAGVIDAFEYLDARGRLHRRR